MLYYFLYPLREAISVFNIFRYITFRAAMAAFTAFLISLIFAPVIIKILTRFNIVVKIRKKDSIKLDELHSHKESTPTMGGLLILFAVMTSTLLWADVFNRYIPVSYTHLTLPTN